MYIKGMRTVNRGTLVDGIIRPKVEVLGPGYSTHFDHSICIYIMDHSVKVMVNYWGTDKAVVFRFRDAEETQHYWSRTFSIYDEKTRYKDLIRQSVVEFEAIFGKRQK